MGNLDSAVDELLIVDPRELPVEARAEGVVHLARVINRLSSAYLRWLESVDRTGAMTAAHGSTAAWLREATRVAPTTASRDVHLARDLADVMPKMAAAMAEGGVSPAHAQAVAGLRRDLPDETVRTVDPHLTDAARTHTPTELRGFVTHVRHSYAPDAVVRDEREAYDERTLTVASTMYGTGTGNWTADPVSQEVIITAIHAASAPLAGDTRSPGQRRFDGLLALCDIAMRSGELPDTGGVRPHATIVVPLATILGLAGAPAAVTGYGAVISGEAARTLTCDADISRVITGPSGEILDSGRSSRSFTAAQRRAIVARDQHCRWPGCDRPPAWCDAHHRRHWSRGGSTSVDNGVLLCGRHHEKVHHLDLDIRRDSDGNFTVCLQPGSGTACRPAGADP
jgi:hypothetical protein